MEACRMGYFVSGCCVVNTGNTHPFADRCHFGKPHRFVHRSESYVQAIHRLHDKEDHDKFDVNIKLHRVSIAGAPSLSLISPGSKKGSDWCATPRCPSSRDQLPASAVRLHFPGSADREMIFL